MHPPARIILITTAVALLGAAGPASAEQIPTRAEVIAAFVQPGFAEPVLRATGTGLTVELRNTGTSVLNVRITAREVAAGRTYVYRPVFKRLAPGARARVGLAAPRRLARVLEHRRNVRRAALANVVNAENNAGRTVHEHFR